MTAKLAQLGAMIRYELLMHWRKRGLMAFLILILLGLVMLNVNMAYQPMTDSQNTALENIMPILMLVLVGLPLLVAEIVPIDRHTGVRELLDSTPLSVGTYLTGKVTAAWVFMLAGLVVVAAIDGLMEFALLEQFSLADYLLAWGLGLIPAALYVTTIGVLIPAGQPTRRRGLFVGLGIAIFNMLIITMSLAWWLINIWLRYKETAQSLQSFT